MSGRAEPGAGVAEVESARAAPPDTLRGPFRCAKDTGLRNLLLHGYAQNRTWSQIVALACELLARMQMLALTGPGTATAPVPGVAAPDPASKGLGAPSVYYPPCCAHAAGPSPTPRPGTPRTWDTQRPHTGRTPTAHRPADPYGHCARQPDSGYRRWPGRVPSNPLRQTLPDLTPTTRGRGQEAATQDGTHPGKT